MFQHKLRVFARAARWRVADYGETHFSLTPEIVKQLREMTYLDRWRESIAKKWYHVLLEDHSVLTFRSTENSVSYAYLQCPLEVPSFREFTLSLGVPFDAVNRAELENEYKMVMDTASRKENVTPIRYDYDVNGYQRGVHPVSHVHIGLDNEIRLAFARRLSPQSFALFVMRQMYPVCWARLLERQEAARLPKVVRFDCLSIHEANWHEQDQLELHFV